MSRYNQYKKNLFRTKSIKGIIHNNDLVEDSRAGISEWIGDVEHDARSDPPKSWAKFHSRLTEELFWALKGKQAPSAELPPEIIQELINE